MPISPYIAQIRRKIGRDMLLVRNDAILRIRHALTGESATWFAQPKNCTAKCAKSAKEDKD